MVLQPLPYNDLSSDRNKPPVFADHYLFTETINRSYEYPEHASGLGLLSTLSGDGDYMVNGRRIVTDARSFTVVNHGSRLSIRLLKKQTEPAFLFFDTRLAASVNQALMLSDDQLLETGEPAAADLAYLERIHFKTIAMRECLSLLPRLGESCSSFHSLKADGIIRALLEKLIVQNCNAAKIARHLNVVKASTRIELFRRLSLCKEWIDANYFLPITLEQMAGVALLNSHHFLRMFRQCYGVTPHRFLVDLRLERSKQLLKESNEQIAVIAGNVGFESLSSFSWLFRQRFGLSPSAFRQQFKL